MTKIVKITQASGKYYWYRDMIGEVVEVKDDLLDDFTGMRYETLDGEFIIDPADVEVIADNEQPATEFHYIADEALGGVEREYKEVDRKAVVGGYVISETGTIRKVSRLLGGGDISISSISNGLTGTYTRDFYKTLSPTGRVRIDGALFKLDKRNAQVDEQILVADDTEAYGEYALGAVLTVDDSDKWDDGTGVNVVDVYCGLFHGEYLVLEPADSKSIGKLHATVDVNTEVLDLIANLSAHVVKLERRLADVEEQADSNKKDVVTVAQDLAEELAEIEVNNRKTARMNNGSIFV